MSACIKFPVGEYVATVDADDRDLVAAYHWHAARRPNTVYVAHSKPRPARGMLLLHRVVCAAPPGVEVDHRDGNGLNNRRANLRLATSGQNKANSRKRGGTTSQYKGVSWFQRTGKWHAEIQAHGQRHYLGYFYEETEAAAAYDAAAIEIWGEFAQVNLHGRR